MDMRMVCLSTQVSDARTVVVDRALHHKSALKELSLSSNSTSDNLAGALHYNSTLNVS